MDDASLSDREQRILEEIERNLIAEDPGFARGLQKQVPRRETVRQLRLSILGFIVGAALLVAYLVHFLLGVLGFAIMLTSVVAGAMAVRSLASAGLSASAVFKDAWRRAETRMRRPKS